MRFLGRVSELALLEEHFASPGPELFVLYGRRRVGKTELLTRFAKDKPAIFFTASQVETADNLKQLVQETARTVNDLNVGGIHFDNLESFLNFIVDRLQGKRQIIVLDEFQYWIMADKSIPSLIQRFWDKAGLNSKLMLVLCGSSISMMIDHTLSERAPLFGRRTGQLELKPLDYRTAAKFFPRWSAREKLIAYAVLGGMPAYLNQFDRSLSLADNIIDKILQRGRFLSEEVNFLLKTELRDVRVYASILRAVAAGNRSIKDLTSKTQMDARTITSYLTNLQALHLVKREVSLTEAAPEKSRKGRYFIEDNFLRFWFAFIDENITLVETNRGARLFNELILPRLNSYMGRSFEDICQQYVLYFGSEQMLPIPIRIGRIWQKDFDIDLAAENLDKSYTFGECKWSEQKVERRLLYKLRENVGRTGFDTATSTFMLFAPRGFKGDGNLDGVFIDATMLLGEV